jgi:hypothetical protein
VSDKYDPEVQTITCTGCKMPMKVHQPAAMRTINQAVSQYLLIPSWGVNERVCRNCHTVMAPIIVDVQVVWGGIAVEEPKGRIVIPDGVLPKERS